MRAPSDFKVQSSLFDVQSSSFSDRLLPLMDGRLGLRTALQIEAHEPPATEIENQNSNIENPSASSPDTRHSSPILDFVASTEALDRYDEIIAADGWRLDNYRRNPVFQNAHQYGDIIFTLGKALITEVRSIPHSAIPTPHLYQRIEFAVDANPMARIAYALYKGKFLNAVSVGFIPIRWQDADGTEHSVVGARAAGPLSSAGGEGQGEEASSTITHHVARSIPRPAEQTFRRKYLEQELLEVSAVGIPANPEALQLGLKAGAIQRADIKDLLDLLRGLTKSASAQSNEASPKNDFAPMILPFSAPFCSPAAPNTLANASGVRSNEAQLLELARALRNILRRT
jgi:hypothetical protein